MKCMCECGVWTSDYCLLTHLVARVAWWLLGSRHKLPLWFFTLAAFHASQCMWGEREGRKDSTATTIPWLKCVTLLQVPVFGLFTWCCTLSETPFGHLRLFYFITRYLFSQMLEQNYSWERLKPLFALCRLIRGLKLSSSLQIITSTNLMPSIF